MRPSKVLVTAVIEVNEEQVGDEHVEEVLGEGIIETQEGGTWYMAALKNDKKDKLQDVKP
jgi:hypothetical protein